MPEALKRKPDNSKAQRSGLCGRSEGEFTLEVAPDEDAPLMGLHSWKAAGWTLPAGGISYDVKAATRQRVG